MPITLTFHVFGFTIPILLATINDPHLTHINMSSIPVKISREIGRWNSKRL